MNIAWIKYAVVGVMLVVSGASLLVVSHGVQSLERKIAQLDRQIAQEQETVRIFAAEWSFLNNPERLEILASKYLDLAPPTPEQLVSHVDAVQPAEALIIPVEEEIAKPDLSGMVHEVSFTVVPARKPSFVQKKGDAR